MGKSMQTLVGAGVIDPTEVPFDEAENVAPDEVEAEKYSIPYTLDLDYPIVMGSKTIESITFNRVPSAGDCMALPMAGDYKWGHFVPIVSACTGETNVVVKRLSTPDFRRCLALVTHFLFVAGSRDDE